MWWATGGWFDGPQPESWHLLTRLHPAENTKLPPCPTRPPQRTDFETRLRRLAAQYRLPQEGSTSVRRVQDAARRILRGSEASWHPDILAKVRRLAWWEGGRVHGGGG